MKDYLQQTDDLTGDPIINPSWPANARPVSWIEKIVVHHEAQFRPHAYDNTPRYQAEAEYQNNTSIPGSKGIQYHYHIDNVGTITKLRPLTTYLWHCGNLEVNKHSVAICVDGNLTDQQPTREQFEALYQLLDNLSEKHPEFPASYGDVYGHRDFYSTNCCGDHLYPFVTSYRQTSGNPTIPDVPFDHPELQPTAPAPEPLPLPPVVSPDPIETPVTPTPVVDTPPTPTEPPVTPEKPTEPVQTPLPIVVPRENWWVTLLKALLKLLKIKL